MLIVKKKNNNYKVFPKGFFTLKSKEKTIMNFVVYNKHKKFQN